MGLFTPRQRARHKRFSYEPRFYDPRKDEDIKRRMRVSGRMSRRRRSPASLLYFAFLLLFSVYLYSVLA